MAEKICVKVYQYDELSEEAKEKARQWWLDPDHGFDFDYEVVFEDAKNLAALIGIEIDQIRFSGFWSQGDGASFTGSYSYERGGVKALKAEAPNETELHAIAEALQCEQKSKFYRLRADITPNSCRYCHENSVDVAVYDRPDTDWQTEDRDTADHIASLLRGVMKWIYRALEKEYDWQTSEECVAENIRANGYEFYADGRRAWFSDSDVMCRRAA